MPVARRITRTRLLTAGVGALAAALGLAACASSSSGGSGGTLHLVAYSTPQQAYARLIPAFQATPAGKDVTFTQSYGASGDQQRAVASGLPADVVALSLAPDVTKLVDAGLVSSDWNKDTYQGMVTDSVVALTVRKGNPKHVKDWSDLVRPGIGVVTPNPFTSGGARWNLMGAYGAQIKRGKSPAQALDFVKQLFGHVVSQDKSARESLQTFLAGRGDVAITYENEAITAQQKGQPVDFVIPPQTIKIENPIAVVIKGGHVTQARAFIDFLRTPAAQAIFVKNGYRPVAKGVAGAQRFAAPPGLFTIASLGGWKAVSKQFFDPQKGSVAAIEQGLGVPTAK